MLEYSTDLFDEETMRADASATTRGSWGRQPQTRRRRLSRLELLGDEERRLLVEEWSGARR